MAVAPQIGVCSPWITPEYLTPLCNKSAPTVAGLPPSPIVPLPEDMALRNILLASEILWVLSGRQYGGLCTHTVRPCRVQSDCACSGTSCGCRPVQEVDLGCHPVQSITEVKIDGVVIDPSRYHVNEWRYFALTPANCDTEVDKMPCCQDMTKSSACEGTWSITFTCGNEPPEMGKRAAAILACELSKAERNLECALPRRVTSITRQGVSMALLDPMEFLRTPGLPLTGIYEVDLFLKAVNPSGATMGGGVWSPDLPQATTKRPYTWP